jgi:hypothetical protein
MALPIVDDNRVVFTLFDLPFELPVDRALGSDLCAFRPLVHDFRRPR